MVIVAAVAAVALAAVALAAGAGRTGPDPDAAVADRVLAAVGQDRADGRPDALALGRGCSRTVEVDEYGFEDEVVRCPDDVDGGPAPTGGPADLSPDDPLDPDAVLDAQGSLPPWVLDRTVAALPDGEIATGLVELARMADELDALCGRDLEGWSATLERAAERAEALAAQAAAEPRPDLVGTTPARAAGRALFERIVLETGCQAPGATALADDEAVARGLLATTSRASGAVAELDRALSDALSSRLFHFYSSLPNYEWLRTQRQPVDLVVYGTSQAGAAIEVPLLASATGVTVGNAFLPGSLAEVQRHWFGEVHRYVDPSRVVWLIGAIDLLIGCEPTDREDQFLERLANRRAAFARSGWFRTIDPIEVLLGPAGEVNLNRGNAAKKPEPDLDAIEAQRPGYAEAFARPGFCTARAAEAIARSVESFEADGRRVTIVGMPLSPQSRDLNPDLAALTAAALDRLMVEYLGHTDAVLVDLTDRIQDPQLWADFTHPTQAGAERFTAELAEAIG